MRSFTLGSVEMSYKPERALTHKLRIIVAPNDSCVEMSYKPERALTQDFPAIRYHKLSSCRNEL